MARTKKIKEPIYFLRIVANNKVYEATGDDLLELVNDFELPKILKTKTSIIVTKDNKTAQRDLIINDTRRLFNNKTKMLLFINNLTSQLGKIYG